MSNRSRRAGAPAHPRGQGACDSQALHKTDSRSPPAIFWSTTWRHLESVGGNLHRALRRRYVQDQWQAAFRGSIADSVRLTHPGNTAGVCIGPTAERQQRASMRWRFTALGHSLSILLCCRTCARPRAPHRQHLPPPQRSPFPNHATRVRLFQVGVCGSDPGRRGRLRLRLRVNSGRCFLPGRSRNPYAR